MIPSISLSNGVEMPQLAMGTCFRDTMKDENNPSGLPLNPNFFGFLPERTHRALTHALAMGYRHIDTALVYRSQKAIGSVLASHFASGALTREDLFITSKLYHGSMPGLTRKGTTLDLENMTPEEVSVAVETQFETILEELNLGYVDLMLLHWPAEMDSKHEGNAARRLAAWKVLEDCFSRGWARSIGVSNFSEAHIEQLMEDGAKILPMVNQIEASVYKQWNGIADYCRGKGIGLMAYSPLGMGKASLLADPILAGIASKHNVEPAQAAMRYLVQLGYAILPLSTSEKRLGQNMGVFSFELDDTDMETLGKLKSMNEGIGLPSPYGMS
eukprot:CAMPEP_0113309764 /NCGR_PEP_ID=MMETSP0010_2-20120614/7676_1 /TAXON_ID=216773 ORGANISM="Corethron hystrix, Strain 308" /NCGR_SAMPLE_ID=MMETSP0010_2 /ASSEMBLY_ACC=CAM_ASM_000155 /LENGTH=328 /DNA_ID=CAMNT_0000165079 /DNA_START=156 /DNA_END=1142 /DNA_ORIENTATION=+ /assembly_acc=CAM_ASM_000155